jgi:GNAT superfamily N-acetyltransferase
VLLDNPLWSSLTTTHRALALGDGAVRRFPPAIAPFLAVSGAPAPGELDALVPAGDTVYLIGPRPPVPGGWRLTELGVIHQMVCERVTPPDPDPEITAASPDDVRALAALVYPHYFRPRTVELGRYFGVYQGGKLAAMAGERMGMPGFREISAVCTHPDFTGRGLARRLLAFLAGDIARAGATPFLHVSPANTRAIRIYDQAGFCTRAPMPFASLERLSIRS